MWFTTEEEKPDIGTVIFKADDYYERLQNITGMWNDNKYLYYEMMHSAGRHESSDESDKDKDINNVFSVSDITDVPLLVAYLEKANMNGVLPQEMISFMLDMHKLYTKKMAQFGHAIHWMSQKEFTMLENREKWRELMKSVEERRLKDMHLEDEVIKRKRRLLKRPQIKLFYAVDSPPPSSQQEMEKPAKKKGKKEDSKNPMTQWQLFMRDRLTHPVNWDFGQTLLFDKRDVRIPGRHLEFTRFYHKISRAIRYAKYQPVDWRNITLEEVDKHRYSSDCWMVLKGRVYDITEFLHKHPGGPDLIMQGVGIDATLLFTSIHPYVVFYKHLYGKQIGTLPFYQEHFHTEWEPPEQFDIFRTLQEWFFRPRNPFSKYQPKTKFEQLETSYVYTVSFPKDLISREEEWTITIINGFQVTIMKYIDSPYVWYGGFDLRNRVMDDTTYRIFSDDYNTLQLEIKKPYKAHIRKAVRDKRQDNGFILISYSLKNMFRGALVERTPVAHAVKLYGITVGMNQLIGCPVGYYVNLRIKDETRPYTPVCLPDEFEEKFKEHAGDFQTIFFIIKEFKDGNFTSMLHHMPTNAAVKGADLYISPAMGNFNKRFLFDGMDTMLLLAGGTGISVMTKIIQEYILNKDKMEEKHVILLFFAQERGDIIWKHVWQSLDKKYKWFHFFFSLTRIYRYSIDKKDNRKKNAETDNKEVEEDPNKEVKTEGDTIENDNYNLKDRPHVHVIEHGDDNSHEIYGYPSESKLSYLYGLIGELDGERKHKAIVCGPYGFNHSCKLMLEDFGLHHEPDVHYFAG